MTVWLSWIFNEIIIKINISVLKLFIIGFFCNLTRGRKDNKNKINRHGIINHFCFFFRNKNVSTRKIPLNSVCPDLLGLNCLPRYFDSDLSYLCTNKFLCCMHSWIYYDNSIIFLFFRFCAFGKYENTKRILFDVCYDYSGIMKINQ